MALFRKGRKKEDVASLTMKILRFQNLLKGNNRVLELIADAEESLGGDFLFDMQYLRWLAQELDTLVHGIVKDLNVISGDQYADLLDSFKMVRGNVEDELFCKTTLPDAPYVMDLSEVRLKMADVVGEKMARLGELKHRLHGNIPDGFVVTGQACRAFFDQPKIRSCIRGTADVLEKGAMTPREAEARLYRAIMGGDLPGPLSRAIKKAVSRMAKPFQGNLRFAVRSSALGEDGRLSFAGLHSTELGIAPEGAIQSYKQVLASLFSARAITYRQVHGQSIESGIMAVGFLPMVNARSAGVLYTLDPVAPEKNQALISASPGLGKIVVDGENHPDQFEVSRNEPYPVLKRTIAQKTERYVVHERNGLCREPLPSRERGLPTVTDGFLVQLLTVSLAIEKMMKTVQDIEWAENGNGDPVILQARPLKIQNSVTSFSPALREAIAKHPVLMSGKGMVAYRGIAHGRVLLVSDSKPPATIPEDTVLVARYSSPALAELASSASAVITDFGAPTSHLATITREMKIPSVMDTGNATEILKDGMEITVDAEENIIYQGKIEELIRYEVMKNNALEDTPEFYILSRMLRHISPLHMKNPQHSRFKARFCTTYHDIIRFAHEKAVLYFFDGHELVSSKNANYVRPLELDVPIDLRVIDIGKGLLPVRGGEKVCRMSDLNCDGLTALIQGLQMPGAWSTDAAGMDFESFMSSMTRYSLVNESLSRGPRPNLAIISNTYLNVNLHLGYHFNQVDSYVSDTRNDNYIYFRFAGGVTDTARRERRAEMISIILKKHDFLVDTKRDFVVARLKKFDRPMMLERLKMIGYLIGFSRQMDVRMKDDSMIQKGVDAFMKGVDITPTHYSTEVNVDKKITVLVLDDESIVCDRLKDFLEPKDISVETFTESDKAIERLKETAFDVVVTDMKMPGSSGMDVLRIVKETQPATQVIIISAYSVIGKLREAEALGSYHYLTKPFQLSALHALIKKAAKHAKTRRSKEHENAH